MNRKDHQKGFGSVEVLLVVLIVVVLAGIGYMIYSKQQDKTDKQKDTNQSGFANEGSTTVSSNTTPLLINELGVKINDPENRQLKFKAVDVPNPVTGDDPEEIFFITDKLTATTMVHCEHPAGIKAVTEQEYQGYSSGLKSSTVVLDGKYYYVGGTNLYGGCLDTEEAMQYMDELQQYVIDNMKKR